MSPSPSPSQPAPRRKKVNGDAAARRTRARKEDDPGRADARSAVAAIGSADLPELFRFWAGRSSVVPADEDELRAQVLEWMSDPEVVEARLARMGRRLQAILDVHLAAQGCELTRADLVAQRQLSYLSSYDLEASLATLVRHALLVPSRSREMRRYGTRGHAVPADLAEALLRQRRARKRGIFDVFTLRGHLDRLYSDPGRSARTPSSRVRELYKMYSNEAAAVARVERLPEGLRGLVKRTIMQFGGLLPKGLFERMETELPHWNGRRWGKILEESLVGTVERLELGRYGIAHGDETLLVFNEVALAWLRRVAVPGDPDAPDDEASLGVDLVSNISRFIAFIHDNDVRFTVRGEIFKTTEKRILQELIPNPGRELERAEVLDFIYHFARDEQLIESTGERTFALTSRGREWEPQKLEEKLRALVDYAVEERELGGEYFHQARMRRIFLRLLKRVEAEVWYDLMYLPFLARNTYLASLDDLAVEDYFTARSSRREAAATDDLQRLAWNVVGWVRKRLYLLGLVDLGYDSSGRPVAMRITRIGARLLGAHEPIQEQATHLGNLVVTPDFEVVLFPTGDDGELVHDLDRFCSREKIGHLVHFRITEKGVLRGLSEGMPLRRILGTLEANSRTPVPQNVVYSIRDWAARGGLLHLDGGRVVRADNAEVLARFRQDPGVRPFVSRVLDEHRVQLKKGHTPRRLASLLRELDYVVELEE